MDGSTSREFKANAARQLANADLQTALGKARGHFIDGRQNAIDKLPEFDALRDRGRDIKNHVIEHLDYYLETFEANVLKAGGQVHWARNAAEAQQIVLDICRSVDARSVNKGKSMISEECGINAAPGSQWHTAPLKRTWVNTSSSCVARARATSSRPPVHVTRARGRGELFNDKHTHLEAGARPRWSCRNHARRKRASVLRKKYFEAEVGMTGANMLDRRNRYQSVIVTNEGNGDLSASSLPEGPYRAWPVDREDRADAGRRLDPFARACPLRDRPGVLAVYTTFSDRPAPRRRSRMARRNTTSSCSTMAAPTMLGTEFQEMLRCIRCGACMNHCPVYQIGRRPRLWLGLSRPDGCSVDAVADRAGAGAAATERLDLLWPLRGGLPHAHPAAEDDAGLPGAGIRQGPDTRRGPVRAERLAASRVPALQPTAP